MVTEIYKQIVTAKQLATTLAKAIAVSVADNRNAELHMVKYNTSWIDAYRSVVDKRIFMVYPHLVSAESWAKMAAPVLNETLVPVAPIDNDSLARKTSNIKLEELEKLIFDILKNPVIEQFHIKRSFSGNLVLNDKFKFYYSMLVSHLTDAYSILVEAE